MKKIIVCLLICSMVFALGACGGKESDAEDRTTETTTEITTETTTEKVVTLAPEDAAYIYNKAYSLANIWFNFYNEYADYNDYIVSEDGFYHYYAINHKLIDSVYALKNYLSRYFTEELIDTIIDESYFDKNGKLYFRPIEAGDLMPTYYLDQTKATLVSSDKDTAEYKIDVMAHFDSGMFSDEFAGDRYESVNVTYVYENGNWVIADHFTLYLYPSYEWDMKSTGM